ncbi:hypothetical protein SAMN04488593_3250 [Microbacterium azadirachtae]|nr:hypothetical protein SAMN04488593_3250 [Microbacterium azadirachtae]SEG53113.1 hypothetical protein SAMN04488592_3245 [Microbacterium azadirachtae]
MPGSARPCHAHRGWAPTVRAPSFIGATCAETGTRSIPPARSCSPSAARSRGRSSHPSTALAPRDHRPGRRRRDLRTRPPSLPSSATPRGRACGIRPGDAGAPAGAAVRTVRRGAEDDRGSRTGGPGRRWLDRDRMRQSRASLRVDPAGAGSIARPRARCTRVCLHPPHRQHDPHHAPRAHGCRPGSSGPSPLRRRDRTQENRHRKAQDRPRGAESPALCRCAGVQPTGRDPRRRRDLRRRPRAAGHTEPTGGAGLRRGGAVRPGRTRRRGSCRRPRRHGPRWPRGSGPVPPDRRAARSRAHAPGRTRSRRPRRDPS